MKDSLLKEQRVEKSKQAEHIIFLEQEIMDNELQLRYVYFHTIMLRLDSC